MLNDYRIMTHHHYHTHTHIECGTSALFRVEGSDSFYQHVRLSFCKIRADLACEAQNEAASVIENLLRTLLSRSIGGSQ